MREGPSRPRPAFARTLAVLLLLGAAACAGGPGANPGDGGASSPDGPLPPSRAPIVFPNPHAKPGASNVAVREEHPVDAADAGWADKLALATGYARGGFDDQALAVVHAALSQSPPEPWAGRFKALRAGLNLRRLETSFLRADARGARDYVAFGAAVDWRIRLHNVSRDPVVFSPSGTGPDAVSATALQLTIVRRDIDIYGAELRRSWTQVVPLERPGGGEVRIPPGGSWEVPARVPAADAGGALQGLRIFQMEGTVRISNARAGTQQETGTLRIRRGRVVALPGGFEPLAADPLGSMRKARESGAPTHLLVASEFVPRDRAREAATILAAALGSGEPTLRRASANALRLLRERAAGRPMAELAEPLVQALEASPPGADALMEGLHAVSDESLPSDPRLWLDWWHRTVRTGTPALSVPAVDAGPAEGP
jgi:hypothetical protein